MGAMHFLMKTLPRVDEDAAAGLGRDGAARLAYNLTRVMNIVGSRLLITAIRA
jgi:hypothetical protein